MFKEQNKTNFPPSDKPVMVWDGQCGFCHYWIIRWKIITGDSIDYISFQKAADQFPDIPVQRFKEAVRLIEPGGRIYSGPAAAFRSFYLTGRFRWMHNLYFKSPLFKNISDHVYQFIANHRERFFYITKVLFGKNPQRMGKRWLYWLLFWVLVSILIFYL